MANQEENIIKKGQNKFCAWRLIIFDAKILTSIVRNAFIKADVDISKKKAGAHSLRHSLATNMLKNNTPLPVIKEILGHTNINTTEKYISVDIEGLRRMSLEVPTYE